MRPALKVRKSRPVHVTVGALMLVIPTSAVALSAAAPDPPQSALQIRLDRRSIDYGQSLTATGVAPSSEKGRELLLELAPPGEQWRSLGSGVVQSNGRFRIVVSPQQSGALRIVDPAAVAAERTSVRAATGTAVLTSPTRDVKVSAALQARIGALGALSGQPVDLQGRLLPRRAGRVVVLELGNGHGWKALARARTGPKGRFDVRYSAPSAGRQPVRLRFAGDRFNGAAATRVGVLTFYRQSAASWYNDGGSTACGFHATYGVANKDLPCGTQVSLRYGNNTVTATVDDRGPYVGGRDWDLNQNTAAALGFTGVDTVWSSP